jgi:hypothetical protein
VQKAVAVSTANTATLPGLWGLACCDVLCNTPACTGHVFTITLVLWKINSIILIVGNVTLEYTDDINIMFERDGDLVYVFC